jgi:hypothetical protein
MSRELTIQKDTAIPLSRFKLITTELKEHAPFTALGAGVGVAIMAAVTITGLDDPEVLDYLFHIFHPAHILLSSIVTAAMFRLYQGGLLRSIAIGFLGALGICTLSDVLFPYVGGALIGVRMEMHVCLICHPWIVVVPGLTGAVIGALTGHWTKCPHAGHVLISTMASLFYLMAFGAFGMADWLILFPLVFAVLFIAVWIPCCASDIVFPLAFAKKGAGAQRR